MANPRFSQSANLAAAITGVQAAETAVVTLPPLLTPQDVAFIVVLGDLFMTYPTGITSLTIKLYRGTSISGTLLQSWALLTGGVVAAGVDLKSYMFAETDISSGQQQYTVSVTFVGASAANGSINQAVMMGNCF